MQARAVKTMRDSSSKRSQCSSRNAGAFDILSAKVSTVMLLLLLDMLVIGWPSPVPREAEGSLVAIVSREPGEVAFTTLEEAVMKFVMMCE